jgi:4-hydroxy-tetrahydrodipicolinate synthase
VAAIEGDVKRAVALHLELLPLHKHLFCEPSPAPVKWALAQMGRCQPHVRLPLTELTEGGQALVRKAMTDCGLPTA